MSHPRHLLPEQPDARPERVLRDRGAVERAEWDDPADTNDRTRKPWQVAGWCRSDPVRGLFPPRSRERDAADRLRQDVDIASGVRATEQLAARVSGVGPMTPTEAQLDAIGRVRAACRVWTPGELEVVSWCVVEGASLTSYEARMRMRHGLASKMLRGALVLLADHYDQGLTRRGRVE